jgi:hypothetical protein
MEKSVPSRVIKAAMEQHNNRVEEKIHREERKVQQAAVAEIQKHLDRANELLSQVDGIRKALKKDGWETSMEGMYGKAKLKLDATLSSVKVLQRIRTAKIIIPHKISENDLLLAIVATGEEDLAVALDKVKILWRPTPLEKHD